MNKLIIAKRREASIEELIIFFKEADVDKIREYLSQVRYNTLMSPKVKELYKEGGKWISIAYELGLSTDQVEYILKKEKKK